MVCLMFRIINTVHTSDKIINNNNKNPFPFGLSSLLRVSSALCVKICELCTWCQVSWIGQNPKECTQRGGNVLHNYSCHYPVQPEHMYICDSTHMQSIALELCWGQTTKCDRMVCIVVTCLTYTQNVLV